MSEIGDYTDPSLWEKVKISELTKFTPGYVCYRPSWWAIVDGDCVLFFKGRRGRSRAPQANTNRAVVERTRPGLEVRFIEQACLPPQD